MLIGELAARAGLSHDTLRYYERAGLIAAQRGANGYRRYPAEAETRLALVRLAQGLGFSLAEIREVLGVMDQAGELPAEQVQALLQAKLAEMDARLAALQRLRHDVAQRLADVCPLRLAPRPSSAAPRQQPEGPVAGPAPASGAEQLAAPPAPAERHPAEGPATQPPAADHPAPEAPADASTCAARQRGSRPPRAAAALAPIRPA